MASAATWPELKANHPIIELFRKLPQVFTASEGYSEIWGLTLVAPATAAAAPPAAESASDEQQPATETPIEQPTFATALILQKFLRANANDVTKAFSQLKDTMVWRKSFFAPGGESSKGWSDAKFAGIGYVNAIQHRNGQRKVVSWNVYGATKDIKKTFGSLDEFIRWRVNLMEESLRLLKLENATQPIPDYGKGVDPYMSLQVHDYMNVSFLRLPSEVKTASKKTIQMFARYYPETLERKFFVNVPTIMSWVYVLLKKVLSSATIAKLEMLSSSKDLASWLGDDIPEAYGGKTPSLETGHFGVHSPKDIDGEAAAVVAAAKQEQQAKKAERAKGAEEAAAVVAAAKQEQQAKKAEEAEEDKKAEESEKVEEAKVEEAKVEEAKVEEAKKVEEVKVEEPVKEETPKVEAPVAEPPKEESKPAETPAPTEPVVAASAAPAETEVPKTTEPEVPKTTNSEVPKEVVAEVPKPAEPVSAAPVPTEAATTEPVTKVEETAAPLAPLPVLEPKADEKKE